MAELEEADLVDHLSRAGGAALVLVLDGVQDAHNLGACLRTADAAGAHAVVAPRKGSAPMNEAVRRIACGGAEGVPYVRVGNLARTLDDLRGEGFTVVGTADGAAKGFYEIALDGPLALVLGAEGSGIRRLTAERCDHLVSIPMAGKVDCLNVSVAAGVCLFEAVRQRGLKR